MKYTYRIPCVNYLQVGQFERWLSDCSAKGLFFHSMHARENAGNNRGGHSLGLIRFEKGAPERKKYRLEPLRGSSDWPPSGEWEMYEEMGWEYAGCIPGLFYVFTAPNRESIPEPHTDPVLEAELYTEMLQKVSRWLNRHLLAWGVVMALYMLNIAILLRFYGFARAFLLQQGLSHLGGIVLIVLLLGRSVGSLRQLRRLKNRLSEGIPIDHNVPYQAESRRFLLRGGAFTVLIVLLLGVQVYSLTSMRLEGYFTAGPLPVPALSALEGEDFTADPTTFDGKRPRNNWVESGWHPLVPETRDIFQSGMTGGEPCSLRVTYYRTRHPSLGRLLYTSLVNKEIEDSERFRFGGSTFRLLPKEECGAFDAVLLRPLEVRGGTLLAFRGSEVLKADYFGSRPLEEVVTLFSAALEGTES